MRVGSGAPSNVPCASRPCPMQAPDLRTTTPGHPTLAEAARAAGPGPHLMGMPCSNTGLGALSSATWPSGRRKRVTVAPCRYTSTPAGLRRQGKVCVGEEGVEAALQVLGGWWAGCLATSPAVLVRQHGQNPFSPFLLPMRMPQPWKNPTPYPLQPSCKHQERATHQ